MLDERLSSSLIIAPFAVQLGVLLGCGGRGALERRGAETKWMWFDGSVEDIFEGCCMCVMHGCSKARTNSIATSGLSIALSGV